VLRKEKLAWESAERHGTKRLPRQKVSKWSIRESVIGNRKKLEEVPRNEKHAWQNEEKHGEKDSRSER
jgi:hypothetical protein